MTEQELPEPPQVPELHVLVASPVYGDMVKRGYAFSMARAMTFFAQAKSDVKKTIDLEMAWSSNLVENRHILVSRALKFGCTHLLFWDSDIKAPMDCIVRMVNHHLPIVAINYSTKEPEPRPTAFIDTDEYTGPCFTQAHHKGLQAVSSCGFGLMLIETRVFQMMETPLFQFTQNGPDRIKTETEDVFFCWKAREAGFDIVIDHDLSRECSHLGDWEFTLEMCNIAQDAKQKLYRKMPKDQPETVL